MADDLGAVLVIALFYTPAILVVPLAVAGCFLLLLALGNTLGIRHVGLYHLLGVCLWLGFLLSGVHATIAGVLVAFTIPARAKITEPVYVSNLRRLTAEFEHAIPQNGALTTQEQHRTIEKIKQVCVDAETPLQKIEGAGLLIGKFTGVFSFVWIKVRLGYAALPLHTTWKHIAGVAILAELDLRCLYSLHLLHSMMPY